MMVSKLINSPIKKVCCFDPGITTGYVTGMIEDGKLGVISGQAKWSEIELYLELKSTKPDIIIYERFDYRSESAYGKHGNLSNVELFPRNLIGVINLYCQERESQGTPVDLYTQLPAQAVGKKPFWTDTKLKAANVYKVANPHANDAMRHMLRWWEFGAGFQYNEKGFELLA